MRECEEHHGVATVVRVGGRGPLVFFLIALLVTACGSRRGSRSDGGGTFADGGPGRDSSVGADGAPPDGNPVLRRDGALPADGGTWDGGTVDADSRDAGGADAGHDAGDPSCVHPEVTASCADGFCRIPAGCFMMGSPESEPCRVEHETLHQVTLTHAFEMHQTEVTQAQFEAIYGYNPSGHAPDHEGSRCTSECPVEGTRWDAAVGYCTRLSLLAGLDPCYECGNLTTTPGHCDSLPEYEGSAIYDCPGYRLPTEAEWEYAYRAGTTSALYNGPVSSCEVGDPGLDPIAWYHGNSGGQPHPVGQKAPNGFGLYDMAGNVWEWTHDLHQDYAAGPLIDPAEDGTSSDYHVVRGGAFDSWVVETRAAGRDYMPYFGVNHLGFRCVRSL